MFDRETLAAAAGHAERLGCETAALLALMHVESGGAVYAVVGGKNEPLIRFEGHYFDRRLTGVARLQARDAGLANATAGAVANPRSQAARWALLNRAIAINANAALESVSWGLGQVMGAHWQWLGYSSVAQLVNIARQGVAGQIELMVRYLVKAGLVGALKQRDWRAIGRGYNGPAFAKHGYHIKLAEAYRLYAGRAAVTEPAAPDGMLRLGSHGARVRELQALLVRAGYPVTLDGDFGPATSNAVRAFQQANGLEPDGVAGPQTMATLDRFRQGAADRPGAQKIGELPEVQGAGRGGIATGLVVALRDQVAETAAALTGMESAMAQWVSNGLLAAAGLIGIGLAAWAVVGWLRSRRTDEVTG